MGVDVGVGVGVRSTPPTSETKDEQMQCWSSDAQPWRFTTLTKEIQRTY